MDGNKYAGVLAALTGLARATREGGSLFLH